MYPYRVDYNKLVHDGSMWHLHRRVNSYRWYWTAWLAAWWYVKRNAWGEARILRRRAAHRLTVFTRVP